MEKSILASAIFLCAFVSNSFAATVWVGNDDVKIYDFTGNYISQFDAGFDKPSDIAVVPEPTTLLLFGLGAVMVRRKTVIGF